MNNTEKLISSITSYRFLTRWILPFVITCFLLTTLLLHNAVEQSHYQSPHNLLLLPQTSNSPILDDEKIRFIERIPSQKHRYKKIRKLMNKLYPPNDEDFLQTFAQQARTNQYTPIHDPQWNANTNGDENGPYYDIFNCPEYPPPGYPHHWNTVDVLSHWNPNDIYPPSSHQIYQGICHFNYNTDYQKALNYRNAEVPFIIRDNPQLLSVSLRWSQPDYLSTILGDEEHKTEYSKTNHLMFYRTRHLKKRGTIPKDWLPPIDNLQMTFDEWMEKATVQPPPTKNDEHYYFRFNAAWDYSTDGTGGQNTWLYNELPFFKPTKPSFFMVEPEMEHGINCRFGMPGNIAETHFDQQRNFVVLMGGERRYVLSHPKYCNNMELYPETHPSGRHSKIDWGNAKDYTELFRRGMLNEVILQAGDALYLPNYWFHFIQSVTVNYQCNARSGREKEDLYGRFIRQCGFGA